MDGLPGLCVGLNCGFSYDEPPGNQEITRAELDGSELTIEGINLPVWGPGSNCARRMLSTPPGIPYWNCADPYEYSVCIAGACCNPAFMTLTQSDMIICTLTEPPMAGNHIPSVVGPPGEVYVNPGFNPVNVPLIVETVEPNTELNPEGGTLLTVTGSGFPQDLTRAQGNLTILVQPGDTGCLVQTVAPTVLTCILEEPDDVENDPTKEMYFQVNDEDDTYSPIIFGDIPYGIYDVYPKDVNPVIKTDVKILLSESFSSFALQLDSFTAYVVKNLDDGSSPCDHFTGDNLEMYCGAINVDLKSLDCVFPGAPSGKYDIVLRHIFLGGIGCGKFQFNVETVVSRVSHNTGSKYGGTKLVLDGRQFSPHSPYDNPVSVDGYSCFVLETDET